MEKLNISMLIEPKSMNELIVAIKKYPDAQLFAGGTFLMSRMGYYPNTSPQDIISLEEVPELTKVLHVDKYVEFGSMVTIQQMLNSTASLFPAPLYRAIDNIATSILRKQITIGGALCTSGIRFALPCFLATVNAQAEIKMATHHLNGAFKMKTNDRWIPVSKLYDSEGNYIFEGKGFLSRVRIPTEQNLFQIFRTVGNPMKEPASTVIMSLTYNIGQDVITNPFFCMIFPKGGFFYSQNFNNSLSKCVFPFTTKEMVQTTRELDKRLEETCKDISEIQRERAHRLFYNTLYQANTTYLST